MPKSKTKTMPFSVVKKRISYQPVSIESSGNIISIFDNDERYAHEYVHRDDDDDDDDEEEEEEERVHPHIHVKKKQSSFQRMASPRTTTTTTTSTTTTAFFLLGLLNNIIYVIVLCAAKTLSEGGVGLVYTANILPALLVKGSSPLWFHRTSYQTRLIIACLSALTALILIGTTVVPATTTTATSITTAATQVWTLVGVACVSLQCGLGEATLLALAGKWDTKHKTRNNHTVGEEMRVDAVVEEVCVDAKEEGDSDSDTDPNTLMVTTAPSSRTTTTTNNIKATALTAFSSGTGLAGPAGFAWTLFFTRGLQWSLDATALVSLVLPVTYLLLYIVCLQEQEDEQSALMSTSQSEVGLDQATWNDNESSSSSDNDSVNVIEQQHGQTATTTTTIKVTHIPKEHDPLMKETRARATTATANVGSTQNAVPTITPTPVSATATSATTTNSATSTSSKPTASMTLLERVVFCYHLWPYCIPLFTVYAAEYACQAGAWTAIGFPTVTTETARNDFYVAAGWWYQTGVFLSRSSGHLCTVNMTVLWILPALQLWNLILFCYIAAAAGFDSNDNDVDIEYHHHHNDDDEGYALLASWLYQQPALLFGAFTTGLFGGAVYVHGYKRITADFGKHQVELALSATSVAEGLGVLFADVASLFIQSCLYQIHGLSGAIVTCPF